MCFSAVANPFPIALLLLGICAKTDDTSFEFVQACLAAGRDLCQDGGEFFSIRSGLFALLVGVCAKVDDTLFDFVLLCCCSEFAPRWMTFLLISFSFVSLLVRTCTEMKIQRCVARAPEPLNVALRFAETHGKDYEVELN